jgi:DNA-binding GntR family transcriptional regulator
MLGPMSRVSGLAERIRLQVLRGDVAPGGWLVEVHLAETYEVARSTIREALRLLEGQGLLTSDHSGGMRVVSLAPEEVAETLRVRAALEGLSAELAAARGLAGPEEERLTELADRVGAAATARDAVLADRVFHRALDTLADNRTAHAALDRLWDRLVVSTAPTQPAGAADEHAALVAVIARGDVEEAGALARRHVLSAL